MIARPHTKVNSAGWTLPPSPPTVARSSAPDDDQPSRSQVQWYGVYDRPIPRCWRLDDVAAASTRPKYDDQTRYSYLEAAHWLIDAPLDELRRVSSAPHPAYHAGHVMASTVLILCRSYPPMTITPATWMMRIREWRDYHQGHVDRVDPPWPWEDDTSHDGYAHCIAAAFGVSVVADRMATQGAA